MPKISAKSKTQGKRIAVRFAKFVGKQVSKGKYLPGILLIAIRREVWLRVPTRPAHDCEGGGVHHDNETEDAEEDVCCFAEAGFGYAFEVEHWL